MQQKRIKHITPNWQAPNNVQAITTLRNQHSHLFNAELHASHMAELKIELAACTPKPIAWLQQTHSNNCSIAEDINYDVAADAAINFNGKVACCIVTADCVPILLTDTSATFVAAIHAGWRGIASGIIEKTIAKAKAKNIIAWIGPCICHNCYVVTDELKRIFAAKNAALSVCFAQNEHKQITFNLKHACKIILKQNNISQIYETSFCTACDNDILFSARKESISCGRIITCIWKDN